MSICLSGVRAALIATECGQAYACAGEHHSAHGPMMVDSSHVAQDERGAWMLLSMIVEPDGAVTGRLLGGLGA